MRTRTTTTLLALYGLFAGATESSFPDDVRYAVVNVWPMPLNVVVGSEVQGPRGLVPRETFSVRTESCRDERIDTLANETIELVTVFKGPLKSYGASTYANVDNATCDARYRCLSGDDCAKGARCYVRSDVRWSSTSACSPTSTLGYNSKCGCCVRSSEDGSISTLPRTISSLVVVCASDADVDDEAHNISVTATSITVTATSPRAAARGLMTVAQLLRYDTDEQGLVMDVVPLEIRDKPLYSWRGVMIDVARHFVPVEDILRLIDAMSAAKLNTLHVHATDSTAWTLDSHAYPELAREGSWSRSEATTYSSDDIEAIVKKGRERFVDVMFELDTPAHTLSIARSHPEMLADCWEWMAVSGFKVDVDSDDTMSLDPTNPSARDMVRTLLSEIADAQDSQYVHIGGDEVKYPCWDANEKIRTFVEKQYGNNSDVAYAKLQAEWTSNVSAAAVVASNKIPVLWQPSAQGFDPMWADALPKNAVYMVWLNEDSAASYAKHGANVVYTTPYYVAGMGSGGYLDVYNANLMPANLTDEEKRNVLGGQVCAWGESMAGGNFGMDFRALAIGAGAAESFWREHAAGDPVSSSAGLGLGDRYNRFLCFMRRYGVSTQPIMPSYCDVLKGKGRRNRN